MIELVVFGIGSVVEGVLQRFAPIQMDFVEMSLCQGDPQLSQKMHVDFERNCFDLSFTFSRTAGVKPPGIRADTEHDSFHC